MSMMETIRHFDGTRDSRRPMTRVGQVREAAKDFRREMLARPRVRFYKTFELIRVPYPSKFGYLNAFGGATPFIHLCNRLFVIQFDTTDGVKTLLAGPSDWEHQRSTPFFAQLDARAGRLAPVMDGLIVKKTNTVLSCLASIGLKPQDIDYITYDHLHTQNLTRWLGGEGHEAIFPKAKLLVMREEWESAQSLIPWQNQWYCPDGIKGIPDARVHLLDDSVFLGNGAVALVRTKGHTEGNHSIVAHTDQGLLVTSENGISLDAYEPKHSKIPGVAAYARQTGAEVIINGNTQEYVVDQYISMVQEKSIAGPNPRDERFPNVAPSSESTGYWLFPQSAPTAQVGDLEFGAVVLPSAAKTMRDRVKLAA